MEEKLKIDQTDRYLQNQMDADERESFEKLLKEDLELYKFVETQKILVAGITKYQEKQSFMQMLNEIKEDDTAASASAQSDPVMPQKGKVIKFKMMHMLAYAASLALIVIALLFLFRTETPPPDLFASNFRYHPDLISEYIEASGAAEDPNQGIYPILESGIEAYNGGQYEEAKSSFETFIRDASIDNYAVILSKFYLAQILLGENQTTQAIARFKEINMENLPIDAAVKWYLGLAYIRTHDLVNARNTLEEIRTNEQYKDRVESILAKI